MSHWTQEAHPMCICGPMMFGAEKPQAVVTLEGCRMAAKATYGIDPHPVLSADVLAEIMAYFKAHIGATA